MRNLSASILLAVGLLAAPAVQAQQPVKGGILTYAVAAEPLIASLIAFVLLGEVLTPADAFR